jgi:hypothetical protein
MNDKAFKVVLLLLIVVVAVGGAVIFRGDRPDRVRLGSEQEDQGAQHVSQAEAPEYGEGEPPTSGDHGQPVEKGAYQSELPDFNTIHNLEHGYIYVSYRPDLPQEEIDKLEALFFEPFTNTEFRPTKVIMAPRAANDSPIILSSWQRSQRFDAFEEQTMIDYYLGNVNKSPEPLAS